MKDSTKEYITTEKSIFQILDISRNDIYIKVRIYHKLVVTNIEEQSILNKRVKLVVACRY